VSGTGTVLIVDGHRGWPAELLSTIAGQGHAIVHIDDIRLVPFFVLAGGVQAVLVDVRALQLLGELALLQCRRCSPATAVVVLGSSSSAGEVKRALDSGATAFLPWPAAPDVVAQALRGRSG
jgi:DNA-binding NarL/FixJ family response regulator